MAIYKFPEPDLINPTITDLVSPLLNQLLAKRGITEVETAKIFLEPDYENHLHSPFLLNDMEPACERLEQAIEQKEKIAIFSDYDCDGIPGAVVLYDFFKSIKYDNFQNYIPHRHYEGFGLSHKAIDILKESGVKVIITIDCGTTNVAEVAHAKEQGIDVIITDHHEPEAVLPAAVAVINPKLNHYPFPHLCGAAVAFKLAKAMLERGQYDIPAGHEKWWLDMVGIATIADMVPLVDENRVFAYFGLKVLKKSRRPGLQQLLKKAGTKQSYLTEDDVGFTIGPRINAASRMDNPEDAFYMLAETDLVKAGERVEHLEKLNLERKTTVAAMTKEIHKRLKNFDSIPAVLVIGSPDWRPSLVGLTAAKLAEEHNRPVFVWGTDGNGVYKGSCRSGGGVSVVKLMQAVPEVFSEFGGHHVAGGFSVKDEHIFTFNEELIKAMEASGEAVLVKEEVTVDAVLKLEDVNQLLIQQLNKLAPFGVGNPKPLFAFEKVLPEAIDLFGKTKEHSKLVFKTESGKLEAIAFFKTLSQFTKEPKLDTPLTLLGYIEQSFFMGRQQLRIRIVDIL